MIEDITWYLSEILQHVVLVFLEMNWDRLCVACFPADKFVPGSAQGRPDPPGGTRTPLDAKPGCDP